MYSHDFGDYANGVQDMHGRRFGLADIQVVKKLHELLYTNVV